MGHHSQPFVSVMDAQVAEGPDPDRGEPQDALSREVIDVLAQLETSVHACAGRIGSAFSSAEDAATALLEHAAGGLSATDISKGPSGLGARASETLSSMAQHADVIASGLEEALAGLNDIHAGLRTILLSAQGLLRMGHIAQFLATQALIEGVHLGGEQGAEFVTAAGRITELAEANRELCSRIEERTTHMASATRVLIQRVQGAAQEARSIGHSGARQKHSVHAILEDYETLVDRKFSELDLVQSAITDDVHAILRGLQFEDMSAQLIQGILRRIRSGDVEEDAPCPVTQTSLVAGTVELF